MKRGLRVFGVAWHTPHQRALGNMPFMERYDLCIEPWRKGFATTQRPMPERMHYVENFIPGYYDFALLHLDQQSIWNPEAGDRITKGRIFMELKEQIRKMEPDLPIVVINHHTPFHDKYSTHETIAKIKEMTEGCTMIVNSYEAQRQWGWGHVITHGLNVDEWGIDVEHFKKTGELVEPPKEPRCVVVMSPAGMEKAYRREFGMTVLRYLEEYGVQCDWLGLNTKTFKTFDAYRNYMSRGLVHFFPGWQSPRPRARTEGMLSGQCVVTTPYHDADTFITSGSLKQKKEGDRVVNEELVYDDNTNGFLTSMAKDRDPRTISNPLYTADLIRHLIMDAPDVALEIGRRGREYARENFTSEIFEDQWREFLIENKLWRIDR